jgi:hypothetical protein
MILVEIVLLPSPENQSQLFLVYVYKKYTETASAQVRLVTYVQKLQALRSGELRMFRIGERSSPVSYQSPDY